ALAFPYPLVLVLFERRLIMQALLIHRVGEPWVIPPIDLNVRRTFRRLLNEALPGRIVIKLGVEGEPYLRALLADCRDQNRPGDIRHYLGLLHPHDIGALETLDASGCL